MTEQTAWLAAVAAVLAAAIIGFFVGRRRSGGRQRIEELESEVRRQADEIEGYRKEVAEHFDQTATLFVSMAGSYKELFEHLSSGYEKLSSGSARSLFQQRVDALLLGSARAADKLLDGAAVAAGAAAASSAAAGGDLAEAEMAPAAAAAPEAGTASDAGAAPSAEAVREAGAVVGAEAAAAGAMPEDGLASQAEAAAEEGAQPARVAETRPGTID